MYWFIVGKKTKDGYLLYHIDLLIYSNNEMLLFFLFDLRFTITQTNAFLLDQPIDCKREMGKKTLFATSGRLGLQNDMLHMTSCVDMGHYLWESTSRSLILHLPDDSRTMVDDNWNHRHPSCLHFGCPKTIQYIVGDNSIKDKMYAFHFSSYPKW